MASVVQIPEPVWRADDDELIASWLGTGGWLHLLREKHGEDMAFSLMLSRVARELRVKRGVAVARQVFQEFADGMEDAAKHDKADVP